jgi:putative ABC transport system substrate-binding protein
LLVGYVGIVEAQQAKKVHRIGYLSPRSAAVEKILFPAFLQGLRELGYTEGKNIVIEQRHVAAGQRERLRELATELVRLKVDVIVASSSDTAQVAKEVTTTIPIIFTVSPDPVGSGLVQSLAHPGGNVTGLSDFHGDLVAKRLELLKEVVPSASRIAFLWNSASSSGPLQLKELQAVAPALGVTLLSFGVKGADDFDRAFAAMGKERPAALVVHGDPLLANHQRRIFEFAVKNRLPAIYTLELWVEAGGLMSYGAHFPDLWRRAVTYVDKILKGAKPADLPVEQPMKFELVINLKAAKQIGLTIPPNVLARADKVIK